MATSSTSVTARGPIRLGGSSLRVVALSVGREHYAEGNPGPEANLDRLMALAEESRAERPDLIVFPEFTTTGWPYLSAKEVRATAERVPGDGPAYRRYAELAARSVAVVCGWVVEEDAEGVLHNTSFLVAPDGRPLGRYRKTHPTPSEEGLWWMAPGDDIPVFDLGDVRVGIAICWDMHFPEVCRSLMLQGADLILHPTVANDRRDICPVRCQENHLPMVISVYENSSYALDPQGRITADLDERGGYLLAEVDTGTIEPFSKYGLLNDPRNMTLARRRPKLYSDLVDPKRVVPWTEVFSSQDGTPLSDEQVQRRFPRLQPDRLRQKARR